ncbi:hypothetical protein FHG87_003837 [Trinorchestia longiramus]|nr:hypothetical protein FHG87_003837 [Trinorchestia longiramus]
MYRVLKEDLRKKPYKMMKRHELTEHHERTRAERSRHILNEITQGTRPNLVFTDVSTVNTKLGFTMESPTGFSTITWLQRNPNLDSEEHSISHKQRYMASKKPRPQSLPFLSGPFWRQGSYLPLILLSSPSNQNCEGNGKQFHKN